MICDIAIPVWNKKELTERCINSVLSSTIFPYRVILIDNASKEETRKYLEGLTIQYPEKFRLIVNKENLGNTAAGNQGLKYSNADYVCILDNDTVVCKGWLSEMVKVAQCSSDIGIVNPSCNSFGLRKKKGQSLETFALELARKNSGKFVELGAAVGFCYLVKRTVINEIGYWDERFSPGYFEDTDYSMRAKKKGYKSVMALGAYIYHDEHASFKSKDKKKRFEKLFKESQDKFHALYGKPRRILYVITREDRKYLDLLKSKVIHDADRGDWANVFIRDTVGNVDIARHGNIRKAVLGRAFFKLKILMRIITKKKKFDVIYIDTKRLLKYLLYFKKLHRVEVICLEE